MKRTMWSRRSAVGEGVTRPGANVGVGVEYYHGHSPSSQK